MEPGQQWPGFCFFGGGRHWFTFRATGDPTRALDLWTTERVPSFHSEPSTPFLCSVIKTPDGPVPRLPMNTVVSSSKQSPEKRAVFRHPLHKRLIGFMGTTGQPKVSLVLTRYRPKGRNRRYCSLWCSHAKRTSTPPATALHPVDAPKKQVSTSSSSLPASPAQSRCAAPSRADWSDPGCAWPRDRWHSGEA